MKQPKPLFLLVGFTILALFAAAADAKSQLPSPRAFQGDAPLPIAQNLEFIKQWDGSDAAPPANPQGNSMAIEHFVVDEHLFVPTLSDVKIYDISDPLYPSLLGSFNIYDNAFEVALAVRDNFAYLTFWNCHRYCYSPFWVIDISNPITPTVVGWNGMDYFKANSIKLSGNYAFTGEGANYVVYDISNPTAPTRITTIPNGWPIAPIDLAAVGDHLYVTAMGYPGGRMEIIDFTTGEIVGSYQTAQPLTFVNVVDSYLYVSESGYRETLHILDISNPAAPVEVNTYRLPWYLNTHLGGQPVIEGNYAYIGQNVFDISNPADPIHVGFYPLSGTWGVKGDYIYVSDYQPAFPASWSILKQTPAMVALSPGVASSMTYTFYQEFPTYFDFPAASVTEPITIAVNPSTAEDVGGYAFARHTFGLSALQGDVQLPTFTFSTPITITLHYSHDDVGVISDEAELALWVWTENGWQDATTTCKEPAPYVRDIINNVLALTICQTGRFALFGPTHQRYFPFIDRR